MKKIRYNKIFNKKNFDYIVGIFTIFSVILVYFTLKEMEVQRNNAYMPAIEFEANNVNIWWGNKEKAIEKNPAMKDEEAIINPSAIPITGCNIGVGVAKRISIKFDYSCIDEMIKYLQENDSENTYVYEKEDQISEIYINGKRELFYTSDEYIVQRTYLLPNGEQSFQFFIPTQITFLIQKVLELQVKQHLYDDSIKRVKLDIEYYDVQEIKYKRTVNLDMLLGFTFEDSSEDYGFLIYSIMPNDD